MISAMLNCFIREAQTVLRARSFALLNTGSSSDAKIPIMAMTTSSSMSVNPRLATDGRSIAGIRCGDSGGKVGHSFDHMG